MKTEIDWENMQFAAIDIAEQFELMDAAALAGLTPSGRMAQTDARWALYRFLSDVWASARRELGESPGCLFWFNPAAALLEILDRLHSSAFQAQVDAGEDPIYRPTEHRCPTCRC